MNKGFLLLLLLFIQANIFASKNSASHSSLKETKGVVEYQTTPEGNTITLYNEDGSIWKNIDLSIALNKQSTEFNPFSFNRNKRTLFLKCLDTNSLYHKVIVNESTNLIKWIHNSNQWKYAGWKEHLLTRVVSVKFNLKENPIKERARSNSRNINIIGDIEPIIEIEKVKRDWIKITYYVFENEMTGWIKWKEKDTLLILPIYSLRELNQ